jgi:hypothetical protein
MLRSLQRSDQLPILALYTQRAPDPCEFKFGNWQTLPPNLGERMRALGAQCNRNGHGRFPESAEGVGQLHLSRRPALRLEQPGTGDEYGRASPNVAQPVEPLVKADSRDLLPSAAR